MHLDALDLGEHPLTTEIITGVGLGNGREVASEPHEIAGTNRYIDDRRLQDHNDLALDHLSIHAVNLKLKAGLEALLDRVGRALP